MEEELLLAERQNKKNRICQVTTYERDIKGRVSKVTDPLGLQEHYDYDLKGQLVKKLDKEGYVTKFGYTAHGDVSQIQYADGREVKLSYNPLRQLQEIEDWLGITRIETDPLGRAKKVLYPDGKEVSYTYGKAGERRSLTYPDGRTVSYGYDENLRLSQLKEGDSVITYDYDQAGRLAGKSFPNSLGTEYQYDSRGHLAKLTHRDKEGILDQYTYAYDLLGNKTCIEKQRRGLKEESGSYQYGYDALGRLSQVAKDGDLLRSYAYDAFGNRTHLRKGREETTYTYNAMNQLVREVTKGEQTLDKSYVYDKRGNLSQVLAGGQIKNQYVYGALNRLESAVNPGGEAAAYVYNGLGYRVGKEIGKADFQSLETLDPLHALRNQTLLPEQEIRYTLDLTRQYHNLLQKQEGEENQTYLWDGNVTGLAEAGEETAGYYLQDELGSPLRLIDGSGQLRDSYGYDEFGQDLYGNQEKLQPFGYTGYQKDPVTETYFAQAREYNPGTGRFAGQDLIPGFAEMPITLNRYSYCFNSPLVFADLEGMWPKWLETVAKVVTVSVAVVAVGVVVVGTGGLAATVIAGAAVGGVVGGMVNEDAGGSYINGWAGGAVAGGVQAAVGKLPKVGTLAMVSGGVANGMGSWITDNLDNIDPYNDKYKTKEQISSDALKTAGRGVICSIPGGLMKWMTDNTMGKVALQELMGNTNGLGEGLNQLFGIIDNLLLAEWNAKDLEKALKGEEIEGIEPCLE